MNLRSQDIRAISIGAFFIALTGCCLMLPGLLRNYAVYQKAWMMGLQEYKIIPLEHQPPQGFKFNSSVSGNPLVKCAGVLLAIGGSIACTYAAKIASEELEEAETKAAIDKLAAIQAYQQRKVLENEIAEKKDKMNLAIDYQNFLDGQLDTAELNEAYYRMLEGFDEPVAEITSDKETDSLPEEPDSAPDSQICQDDSQTLSASFRKASTFQWSLRLLSEAYPDTTPEELFRLLAVSAANGEAPRDFIRKSLKCTEGQDHPMRSYTKHGKSLYRWLIENFDDGTIASLPKVQQFLEKD